MPQYSDHITPVAICFFGLSLSAITNIANICCHHDRPFQLLSTRSVRLNIVLPIIAPFILIAEAILFMFVSHFDIAWLSDALIQNTIFLCLPVIPLALSAFASAANVKLTAPTNRNRILRPFARRVNADEQMLLESRRDGIPEIVGDTFSDRQARTLIDTHYNGVFWTEFACLLVDILFSVPWLLHVVGWSS
jgi:hypothetical protein